MSVVLSVVVTVYLYYETDEQSFDGSSLNWVLLTFAVVTPMITSVRLAFTRRENALASLARLRTNSIKLYGAHVGWDFDYNDNGTTGRSLSSIDWLDHSDQVLTTILNILSDAIRYLTMPTSNRARHRVTAGGQKEAIETLSVSADLFGNMVTNVGKLCDYCEVLKKEGLPPQEAIRVRNWEVFILRELEVLRMIKRYRSRKSALKACTQHHGNYFYCSDNNLFLAAQALRSFGRLFSIFLPAFYAPYYVHISREVNSLGYGIAFACLTSLVLTSLFETVFQLEDPFLAVFDLDGIRVGQGGCRFCLCLFIPLNFLRLLYFCFFFSSPRASIQLSLESVGNATKCISECKEGLSRRTKRRAI